MNCANHPDVPAAAYCRECGKPMCQECQRPALGSIYCAQHAPAAPEPQPRAETPNPEKPPAAPKSKYARSHYAGFAPAAESTPYPRTSYPRPSPRPESSPYTDPRPPGPPAWNSTPHPALALMLGFIPGVGAIYNGQYAKGLIHAVVFGLLVSIAADTRGPLEPLFGILIAVWVLYMAFEAYHTARMRRHGVAVEEFSSLFEARSVHGRFPAGALILIALGFILLLNTTDLITMDQMERYWPVGLIVLGLYLLYARLSPPPQNHNGHADRNAEARK